MSKMGVGGPMRFLFGASAAIMIACPLAAAEAPPKDYYLSMRALQAEDMPRYARAAEAEDGDHVMSFQACDDNTYYLTPEDLETVATSIAGQEIVQLNSAEPYASPDTSGVVCIIHGTP